MNILEVQDLCKTYGKGEAAVQALRHATFSVRKGEFIAIIGESGSGKSTLLNVVGALDKATSGKVWIDGQDIFSMPEKKLTVFRRQHIGFIFQSFNLIPATTSGIDSPAANCEMTSDSAKTVQVLDIFTGFFDIAACFSRSEISR